MSNFDLIKKMMNYPNLSESINKTNASFKVYSELIKLLHRIVTMDYESELKDNIVLEIINS